MVGRSALLVALVYETLPLKPAETGTDNVSLFQTYRYLIQILLSGIINKHFIRCVTIKSLFLKHTYTKEVRHSHVRSYSLPSICSPCVEVCTNNSDTS